MITIVTSFLKKTPPSLKLFTFFFMILSSIYFIYNIYNIDKIHSKYDTILNETYSVARRFSSFYNNTNTITLNKGQYLFNGVSVVVNTHTNAKILSTGMNELGKKINQLTDNNIPDYHYLTATVKLSPIL
ncbi:hypothetical protein [Photobacterium iliopiscarium]|uniref:hypothetical protein n=1 Tax=Photobacterium iliopiscarium TaxID=56192 RepID=UPI000D166954|nr:hypothetical protein [Photobacterium iliopiscarium]